MGDHIELEIPARTEFLAMVRAIVTLIAETGSKLPSPRIDDLRLAVTEAFANAIDAERRKPDTERRSVVAPAVVILVARRPPAQLLEPAG